MRTREKVLNHEEEARFTEFLRLKRRCDSFSPTQLNTSEQHAQEIDRANITRIATKRRRTRESHSRLMLHSQLYTIKSINLKTFKILLLVCVEFTGSYAGAFNHSASCLKERQICQRCRRYRSSLHPYTVIALGFFEVLKRRDYIYNQSAADWKPRVTKWTPHNHSRYRGQKIARESFLVVKFSGISKYNDYESSANGLKSQNIFFANCTWRETHLSMNKSSRSRILYSDKKRLEYILKTQKKCNQNKRNK